jgi:hypothetical protein
LPITFGYLFYIESEALKRQLFLDTYPNSTNRFQKIVNKQIKTILAKLNFQNAQKLYSINRLTTKREQAV